MGSRLFETSTGTGRVEATLRVGYQRVSVHAQKKRGAPAGEERRARWRSVVPSRPRARVGGPCGAVQGSLLVCILLGEASRQGREPEHAGAGIDFCDAVSVASSCTAVLIPFNAL